MATTSPKVSALGMALDHTTISSPTNDPENENGKGSERDTTKEVESTAQPDRDAAGAGEGDVAMADASPSPTPLPSAETKRPTPRKRERTDSMKRMVPLPAAQRAKPPAPSGDKDNDGTDSLSSTSPMSATSTSASTSASDAMRLPVKDRTGNAVAGLSRQHLISNAVKTAPPAKEKSNPRRWSKHEDESLKLAVERSGERNWKAIAEQVPGRNHTQCLQRWTKVLKPGLIKGHWDPEEDAKLRDLVAEGKRNWGQVASLIPGRTSKQCRERWCNHLDPNINKGAYTEEEDRIITEMQGKLGNRWSIIAQQLKGRTEDAVKIRWKSLMRGKKAASRDGKDVDGGDDDLSSSDESSPCTTPASHSKPAEKPVRAKPAARAAANKQRARTTPSPSARASASTAKLPIKTEKPAAIDAPVAGVLPPQLVNVNAGPNGSAVPDSVGVPIDSKDVAASINMYVQNMTDLVTASIQNFKPPGFPAGVPMGADAAPASQGISGIQMPSGAMLSSAQSFPVNQGNPPFYSFPPGSFSAMGMPQQGFPMQPSYQLPPNAGLPPNYVVPTPGLSYQVAMQQMPTSMAMPNGMGPYGAYGGSLPSSEADASAAMSFQPGQIYSNVPIPMAPGLAYSAGMMPPYAVHSGAASNPPISFIDGGASMRGEVGSAGIPPLAPSISSRLTTPRDEWGSSQTPRSHLINAEGHASAYELFHQQRLRLMLKEQQKGMSLVSAPSPGQALLTKELKANKARQKRQEIMRTGWKSAVEAMMGMNNDTPTLDDNESGLLGKVDLASIDPTEDALMTPGPEITDHLIAADDTIAVGTDNPAVTPRDGVV